MFEPGAFVIALHGQRGYVKGEIVWVDGDQAKLLPTHYADRDYNWSAARGGRNEPLASVLVQYCRVTTPC